MKKQFIKYQVKCLSSEHPFSFLDKKIEDMKRINKLPPKRESLLLYRDCLKMSKKFTWRNEKNGKEWYNLYSFF